MILKPTGKLETAAAAVIAKAAAAAKDKYDPNTAVSTKTIAASVAASIAASAKAVTAEA